MLLPEEHKKRIHENALTILADVGVQIDHPEVFDLLCQLGGRGDKDTMVVRLDPDMVAKAVASSPRTVGLADLEGRVTEVSNGTRPLFWGGNALYFSRGRNREMMTGARFVEMVRLYDTLDHVHSIVGTSIADFAPQTRDFVGLRRLAEHSGKHMRPVIFTPTGAQVIIEMCQAILEMDHFQGADLSQAPIVSFGFTIVSPLHWTNLALDVFKRTSGLGIPVMVNSEVIAGTTGPVTLAGALCLSVAEVLSGVVIVQALEKGRPIIFNAGFPHVFDMQTGETLTGCTENGALQGAGGEMAAYFGLPSSAWMSTESPVPDGQATFEKLTTGLQHAQSGVNLIWGIGNLESTLTLSLEQAVIDNEIAASIQRTLQGIDFREEKLALDLIREMGQRSDYLSTDHTFEFFREELQFSKLWVRERRGKWEEHGGLDLTDRAAQAVDERLKQPGRSILDDRTRRRLADLEKHWIDTLTGS